MTALPENKPEASAGARRWRVGVVGGTFDPIHVAHVAAGVAARDELGLDVVLFMPAGIPSFKRDRSVTPARDRLAMTRLAVAGLDRCRASAFEVDRPGVTYTADTLEQLARRCPSSTELFFVMGADSLETLPLWRRVEDVVRLATVVVARRDGHDVAPALTALDRAGLEARVLVLEATVPAVSSTGIRRAVAAGADPSDLVGARVADYIREHGLYRH